MITVVASSEFGPRRLVMVNFCRGNYFELITINIKYFELFTFDFSDCSSLKNKTWQNKTVSKKGLSLIVRVNVVLNRTVFVDSDWRFDNLCGSHLQSQSELYPVSWWYSQLFLRRTPWGPAVYVSVLERCPSYRESNKGSKETQGPTLSVRFTEVSVKRE